MRRSSPPPLRSSTGMTGTTGGRTYRIMYPMDSESRRLVAAIEAARGLIVVLTGAGISLASGIPTFRGSDPGAIWAHDITELATLRYFTSDPVGAWRWYRERFLRVLAARPNHGPSCSRRTRAMAGATSKRLPAGDAEHRHAPRTGGVDPRRESARLRRPMPLLGSGVPARRGRVHCARRRGFRERSIGIPGSPPFPRARPAAPWFAHTCCGSTSST